MPARRLKAHDTRSVLTRRESRATPIMLTILVVILLLVALGALPTWPYSRGWGYYPSGGLGLIVLVLVILLLMGRI
jgi:membrane protein YdbS with pleckstrin-like domain